MPKRPVAAAAAKIKIDPELKRQMDAESPGGAGQVEAVLYLRPAAGEVAVPPERMEALAKEILGRAASACGEAAQDFNVFGNLGMFVVVAGRPFMRELLKQPEVASATANR